MGMGMAGSGRFGSGGAGTAVVLISVAICDSRAERGPGWSERATKRVSTSRAAESEAAAVCARTRGGSAWVALLLLQAATTSLTAWCSSSAVFWMRSRFSRKARETAVSMGFVSCAIAAG